MRKLPPEWAPQCAVLLTWPNASNIWKPSLAIVEKTFVELAKAIAQHEMVLINGCSQAHCDHVRQLLENAQVDLNQIKLYPVPSHDVWARDHGPITVLNDSTTHLLDFIFNGWGNKYPADSDNAISKILHQQKAFGSTPLTSLRLVLEGGSIETDGQGTLLTTSSCLLAKTRNPDIDKVELEKLLQQYLGVERILWLNHGYLAGDDTDGHIDTLARFIDPHTICYVRCDDPTDEHYVELSAMEQELKSFCDYQGQLYRLVPLPWPKPKFNEEGERLPNTYANFLIINNAVLMPTYDTETDELALSQLQHHFPDRQVIGIPCNNLIEHYGSLHCVTMQLPQGVL